MIRLTSLQKPLPDRPWAGMLRGIDAPAGRAELRREFAVDGLGAFSRGLRVPLYSQEALASAEGELGFAATDAGCIGAAASCGRTPISYITARHGIYEYHLPVYDRASFSPLGWRSRGYLVAEAGSAEVFTRRVGFWIVLGLAAALALCCGYLAVRYGFSGAVQAVRQFVSGLRFV